MCVCVCGKERQLSAGGSCRWKTPSFLPWMESSSTHDFFLGGGQKSSDAAKRYSELPRTSNYNAAHFCSLLNCAGGRMGAVKVGADV